MNKHLFLFEERIKRVARKCVRPYKIYYKYIHTPIIGYVELAGISIIGSVVAIGFETMNVLLFWVISSLFAMAAAIRVINTVGLKHASMKAIVFITYVGVSMGFLSISIYQDILLPFIQELSLVEKLINAILRLQVVFFTLYMVVTILILYIDSRVFSRSSTAKQIHT